jgi:hypothetical protein
MENIVMDKPNLVPETVPVQNVDSGLESIAAKMAAMRNQDPVTKPVEAGLSDAAASEAPVAPEGVEINDDNQEPEVVASETQDYDSNEEATAPAEVSTADSSSEDIIDFLEFAEENPNAKFKFKRNGETIEIDAKKAAAILGQGAAISEDARQLKIQKAEFDEYLKNKRAETDGLMLAMEFTVRPQLQRAYDEILKTQEYQNVFQQQLSQTQDPAQQARIRANMAQNERYLQQQAATINQLKPNLDNFYAIRKQQIAEVLENNRKAFRDTELKNKYVFDEVREKVAKDWGSAKGQLVPGIDNIDLISSDEHILSLIRDGLKYRDRPRAKTAGGSIAALTSRKGGTTINAGKNQIESLQEKARAGDVKAQENLLVAKMNAMRAARRR